VEESKGCLSSKRREIRKFAETRNRKERTKEGE
jgi:hypothetical protein